MAEQPLIIESEPGISRDGTALDGGQYTDGQWCRFQRGRPKKIAGYSATTSQLDEISRGMTAYSVDGSTCLHLGGATKLQQIVVNKNGVLTGDNLRTPSGLVSSANNLWQFATIFDAISSRNKVFAHVAQNLSNVDSSIVGSIYWGDVCATSALTVITQTASGGIVALHPYLFAFGADGVIAWSAPNAPDDFSSSGSGSARVTGSKVVAGRKLRGGGVPAGLFWSLDSLIKATFVGGTTFWDFDTLADEISILSTRSIIEYDGIHFWLGNDRILMFNGVTREVPNNYNINHLFDNLNYDARQKVFAFKVLKFGEIWWCYPRGTATECTHAIIYNIREGYWYDTQLPASGRSDGVSPAIYNKPFMTGVDVANSQYTLWQHETGVNEVTDAGVEKAIPSHFETAELTMFKTDEPSNASLRVARLEPDFIQTGNLRLTVRGRDNARSTIKDSSVFTFPASASGVDEELVDLKEIRRLLSFKFESNERDGNYEMGQPVAHVGPTGGRVKA